MPNRVYYAVTQLAITSVASSIPDGPFIASNTIHGVQSVTTNVNFNTESILELGQIDNYTTMEDRPDVGLTVEKVFDGYPLVFHQATMNPTNVSNNSIELASRSEDPCKIGLGIYPDSQTVASGDSPTAAIIVSSAYIDSIDYNLVVDGNFTESITFTANDRVWYTGNWFDYDFDGTNEPQTATTGIARRWNIVMGTGVNVSKWPTDIRGIDSDGWNEEVAGVFNAHVQSVRISTSLGRTDLLELGRKAPYYRYANFPVDVTTAIESTTTEGDWKDAAAESDNLTNETIDIYVIDASTFGASNHKIRFNLGNKNKLTSIDLGGGDTGGGVVTATYNYTNQNKLTVMADDDDVSNGVA